MLSCVFHGDFTKISVQTNPWKASAMPPLHILEESTGYVNSISPEENFRAAIRPLFAQIAHFIVQTSAGMVHKKSRRKPDGFSDARGVRKIVRSYSALALATGLTTAPLRMQRVQALMVVT